MYVNSQIYKSISINMCVCLCVCAQICPKWLSCVWIFATLWTVAHQAPLSMEFSRQEYWSGLLFPSPGDLFNPGIKLAFLMSSALTGRFFITNTTWEDYTHTHTHTFWTSSYNFMQSVEPGIRANTNMKATDCPTWKAGTSRYIIKPDGWLWENTQRNSEEVLWEPRGGSPSGW